MVLDLKLETAEPNPAASSLLPGPTRAVPGSNAMRPLSAQGNHARAILWTATSLALAAGGAAAYVLADHAVDDGVASCRERISLTSDSCSSERFAIRAWDVTAAVAWTGAVVAGVFAVVLWTTPERSAKTETSVSVVAGPAAILAEGHF
jgi:hypothetical protein